MVLWVVGGKEAWGVCYCILNCLRVRQRLCEVGVGVGVG